MRVADNTPAPIPLNPKKLTLSLWLIAIFFMAKLGAKIMSRPPAIPEMVRQRTNQAKGMCIKEQQSRLKLPKTAEVIIKAGIDFSLMLNSANNAPTR